MLAELADGHAFGHPPAQRRDGFRAHGMLPSKVRLEPHDLRTGRAAAYITAECLPLLPRERFSPLAQSGPTAADRFRRASRRWASERISYQVAVWLTHGAGSLAGIGMIHGGDHPSGVRHGCCRPAPL